MSLRRRVVVSAPHPALVAALVAACGAVGNGQAAGPTVDDALAQVPAQKGVDYDRPTAAEAKTCTIGKEREGTINALVVRGPSGDVLRSFADTNGDGTVDRFSYYKDGIEVYRDIDSDHDKRVDQARWLNSAGSRWGVDDDGNATLDTWKTISAEEASAEIVEAIKNRDAAAFARLLPTKDDLKAAGFEGERLAELLARVAAAPKAFAAVAASQKQLGADARWASMLTPQPPGVLPAGQPGVARDVVAYDNVVAIVDGKGGGGQVFVGSLVRCGDCWRPIDAPQVAGSGGELGEALGFFTPRPGGRASGGAGPLTDDRLKPLFAQLREVETKLSTAAPAARRELAAQQVAIMDQVLAAAADADRPFWVRQIAETLAAYVQGDLVPDGIGRLDKLTADVAADPTLSAFVTFRLIQSRYALGAQQAGADGEKADKARAAWLAELAAFVDKHPASPDAAEAMLQLAIEDEFSGREKESLARYAEIVAKYPDSVPARKARGASRRLESVGKPLALSGTTLDGKTLAIESLKGVPVLVHYWATWCEPCKVDIAQIRELQAKYGPKKFVAVGIALDNDKAALAKFLQAKQLGWPQLHDAGGLDGRLAEELGILTLPTMLLLDAEGKVVDRNLVITELEKKLETLVGGK
jgi:thiol-disulfide isomerase/thioredoxin